MHLRATARTWRTSARRSWPRALAYLLGRPCRLHAGAGRRAGNALGGRRRAVQLSSAQPPHPTPPCCCGCCCCGGSASHTRWMHARRKRQHRTHASRRHAVGADGGACAHSLPGPLHRCLACRCRCCSIGAPARPPRASATPERAAAAFAWALRWARRAQGCNQAWVVRRWLPGSGGRENARANNVAKAMPVVRLLALAFCTPFSTSTASLRTTRDGRGTRRRLGQPARNAAAGGSWGGGRPRAPAAPARPPAWFVNAR